MLVVGGHGSFAQITAPLRVTLRQAKPYFTGCDCVQMKINAHHSSMIFH